MRDWLRFTLVGITLDVISTAWAFSTVCASTGCENPMDAASRNEIASNLVGVEKRLGRLTGSFQLAKHPERSLTYRADITTLLYYPTSTRAGMEFENMRGTTHGGFLSDHGKPQEISHSSDCWKTLPSVNLSWFRSDGPGSNGAKTGYCSGICQTLQGTCLV